MSRKPVHLVLVEGKSMGDSIDHNKFYDMFEINGECHCRYGRQTNAYTFGKTGSLKTYPINKWESIYNQKLSKGYEDKSYLVTELVTQTNKDGESKYAPITDAYIAEIVERLQRYAKEIVDANYSVKAGQVTKAMIKEAQRHLNMMTVAEDMHDFNLSLLELFKTIPRSMSSVDGSLLKEDTKENRGEIISHEQDLLDVLIGLLNDDKEDTKKTNDNSKAKQTILEANGITMEAASPEDIKLVKEKIGSNAHRLKNVWKISNAKQTEAYQKYVEAENIRKRDCKLLWHGTRSENVWSILKSGLVLRPTNAVITGKMFGYGIYFAPSAQKSLGYTSLSGSYWAKGKSNSGFMLLHAVAYGTPYDVYRFDNKYYTFDYKHLRKHCPNANCLHAHKDAGMIKNDEIIVYREDQVMPLYLVELSN